MSNKLVNRAINSLYQYLSTAKKFDLSDIYVVTRDNCMTIIVYHANVRPLAQVKKYVRLIDQTVKSLKRIRVFFINDLNPHTTRTQLIVLNDSATHRKLCFSHSDVLNETLQGIDNISYVNLNHYKLTKYGSALLFRDPCTKQQVYANIKK